jgi:hypothetical protein
MQFLPKLLAYIAMALEISSLSDNARRPISRKEKGRTTAGRDLSSLEHRRGSGKARHTRVPAVPLPCDRFPGGAGDADPAERRYGVHEERRRRFRRLGDSRDS